MKESLGPPGRQLAAAPRPPREQSPAFSLTICRRVSCRSDKINRRSELVIGKLRHTAMANVMVLSHILSV